MNLVGSERMRERVSPRAWIVLAGLIGATLAPGCTQDVPQLDAQRETVKVLWDPTTATLPTPTDLVRDQTSGKLALPVSEEMTPAEQEWRAWLNTLDGYPQSTTITIPVSGPIDEATLPATIILVDHERGMRVPVNARYDAEFGAILATPQDPSGAPALFEIGKKYTFGVWGYDSGLSGAAGEPVVADAAFYFARSEESLLDHPGALPGETLDEKIAAATALEDVRTAYATSYQLMSQYGVTRDQLAAVSSFTVTSSPTYWFDPDSGQVPVPNNLLLDRESNTVTLPIREGDDEEARHIKETLSLYDGFSTTGAITVKVTDLVDTSDALNPENFRVFRLTEDNSLVEHEALQRGVLDDGQTMWVKPELAFEPASQYLYVLKKGIRTQEGREIRTQPIGALLKLRGPLVVDGVAQIGSVNLASSNAVEPSRKEALEMLDALERQGYSRDEIALAVPFRTIDAPKYLMDWRAKLYKQNIRTDVVNTLIRTPRERGISFLLPNVETVVSGQLTTLEHLDPKTLAMREGQVGEERLVDFVLTIPEDAPKGEPLPVVVFGHGLETSRELLYFIADKLAENGYAAISMDLALHGNRSVCLRDTDCKGDGSTCDEFHECRNPNGTKGEIKTIANPFGEDGPVYPTTSGEPFIDLENIQASRDHFIQAVVDLSQLVRVVRGADWNKATGGYLLDGEDVVYLGMSLGGILGANMAVVEPTITTFVLNVPGAGFFEMVENSAAFRSLFDKAIEHRGVREGTDGYFQFENAIRWMLDPVDPVNLTQHMIQRELRYIDPVDGEEKTAPFKRVQIQMAKGDSIVPNITTEILSARSGIDYRLYEPEISNHVFFFLPINEGRRAQNDMIDFFANR